MITCDSNLLSNLNRSFIILNSFVAADAASEVTTALVGGNLITAVHDNFALSDIEAPGSTTDLVIGMTGKQLLDSINNNFTAKSDSVSSTFPIVGGLLNIGEKILAIYDPFDLTTVTKDGSDVLTAIVDKLKSGRDLTGGCIWSATDGLKFSVDKYLKSTQWPFLVQPLAIYILLRQNSQTEGAKIIDGFTVNHCALYQHGDSGESCYIVAKSQIDSSLNKGLGLGEWGVIRLLFNGVNSYIKPNDTVNINGTESGPMVFDCGVNVPNGITLGAAAGGTSAFSDIDIQAMIIVNAVQSSSDEEVINNFFKSEYMSKYRFPEGKVMIGWDGDIMPYIKTGHDILQSYGIKDTLYVCGSGGGGTDNQAMWDIIAVMAGNGTDIQFHGKNHPMYNTLTEAQVIQNIADTDNLITTVHGYPETHHIAYPYGYSNKLSRATVANYKLTGRGVRETQLYGKPSYLFDLPAIGLGEYTNSGEGLQKCKDQIDYAKANKTICRFYLHGVAPTGVSSAGLTALAEYITSSGITDINASELYTLIS